MAGYIEFLQNKITDENGCVWHFKEESGKLFLVNDDIKILFEISYNPEYEDYYISLAKQLIALTLLNKGA